LSLMTCKSKRFEGYDLLFVVKNMRFLLFILLVQPFDDLFRNV